MQRTNVFTPAAVARARRIGVAAAAVIALTAVGCGSSDDDGDGSTSAASGSGTTASATDPLGAPRAASGEPIVLGMINMEGGLGSMPELGEAARAAVEYVNEYRGGVNGRPLKLDYCTSTGDPATSATCANRFADSKPLAVLGGSDLGTVGSMPILEQARIPYVGGTPYSAPEFTSPNSFQFIGTSRALFTGEGVFVARELRPSKVAVVGYNDIPSGREASAAIENALKENGVSDVTVIGRSVRATDETPSIAAAAKTDPDVIIDINAGQTCVSAIKSARTLAPQAQLVLTAQCTDPRTLESVGSAAEGMYLTQDYVPLDDTSDRDVALFRAAMEKFAPKAPLISTTQTGFSTVVNIADALQALPERDLTAEALVRWLRGTRDQPNFMGHPYSCDGRYRSSPALCNGGVRVVQLRDGKPVAVSDEWYDGMAYFPVS